MSCGWLTKMAIIEQEASIMIRRPLSQVFKLVADPGRFKLWQPFVVEAAITSKGPTGPGTTYRYTFKAMGKTVQTTGKIIEYQPPAWYTYESTDSPFPIRGGFKCKQAGEFIEVTVFGQAEPTGSLAMAGPLIGMLLTRQLNVTLLNLKKLLESSG